VASALLGGIVVAAMIGFLIIRFSALHARFSSDVPSFGAQKFHFRATPRVGGIPIVVGAVVAVLMLRARNTSAYEFAGVSLVCGAFAFAGGMAEDFTKRISVRLRLLLTFVSATLGFFFLDARIDGLDVPGLDWALQFTLVSFVFTVFAVGGFAQAMNIVDGFNGLAGVVSLIFLGAIAYVAQQVGDQELMWSSLVLGASILGFLLFNYPRGLIFLGDGGAYLIGFLIAEFAVLLVHRNTEVSPWFALALLVYPIVETVFSIYRKRVLRNQSAGQPDGLHLHMLIHKRCVRRYRSAGASDVWANALTAPFLWILALLGAVPAVLFWDQTAVLEAVVVVFTSIYIWLYWQIIRFRAPKSLALRRGLMRKSDIVVEAQK
jgi:UDP-N-acetylmuramyl pentapeptide phosphotransferase/UDP-N-acetylglucosamine-1-phosphate transferase